MSISRRDLILTGVGVAPSLDVARTGLSQDTPRPGTSGLPKAPVPGTGGTADTGACPALGENLCVRAVCDRNKTGQRMVMQLAGRPDIKSITPKYVCGIAA